MKNMRAGRFRGATERLQRCIAEEEKAQQITSVAAYSDELIRRIKARAAQYTNDNIKQPVPRDFLLVETAMLVGANIQAELEISTARNDYPLANQFGT